MIYEFNCEACNNPFEVNLPMADNQKPLSEPCPLCGVKGKVYRVFGGHSIDTTSANGLLKKAGNGYSDLMQAMHKANPTGNCGQFARR
jgi:putative FmdB family regulatory protein